MTAYCICGMYGGDCKKYNLTKKSLKLMCNMLSNQKN